MECVRPGIGLLLLHGLDRRDSRPVTILEGHRPVVHHLRVITIRKRIPFRIRMIRTFVRKLISKITFRRTGKFRSISGPWKGAYLELDAV